MKCPMGEKGLTFTYLLSLIPDRIVFFNLESREASLKKS